MKISLTDQEVTAEIRSDSLRNRVRKMMRESVAIINDEWHGTDKTITECYRMELEAAEEIIEVVASYYEIEERE